MRLPRGDDDFRGIYGRLRNLDFRIPSRLIAFLLSGKSKKDGHILAKDDHHGNQNRNSDDHHGHVKRSADDHHGHQKRSEHVEHLMEMHDHQKRNTPEGHGEHHLVKRSGTEGGGHRHHRSTDQGIDEDEPEDEIQSDDTEETTEETETRKRRHTDTPLPTFPSDHDASEHSNSVAIRVKRVSRAGSSHKVRTLNKNRGNSKAGETTQNDSLSPNSGGVFNT
uniref:Uncharacterized protein n=1 Tax=Caenorhabditis tropicalis TaxID=1561998 RepID=A0A1I7UM78_9PELO